MTAEEQRILELLQACKEVLSLAEMLCWLIQIDPSMREEVQLARAAIAAAEGK